MIQKNTHPNVAPWMRRTSVRRGADGAWGALQLGVM